MNSWPYKYFTPQEVCCKGFAKGLCDCGGQTPLPEFMERLEALREAFGEPIVVTSGFRCVKYNEQVAKSGSEGEHTTGRAADIGISGSAAFELLGLALAGGFTRIGVQQKGEMSSRFLHLGDTQAGDKNLPSPAIWSY